MITGINERVIARIVGAALVAIAVLVMAGCGKTYSRDEFTKMVTNKTEAEIKSSLGEPDWINESEPIMWTYRRTTFDATKGNERDAQAVIIFGAGGASEARKAIEVRFD